MKPLTLSITAAIAVCFSFTINSKKSFTPPGTVQINDTLFADNCEMTNFSWLEYEWSIERKYGKNSKEHLAVLPDTTVWREKLTYNEPYVQYYYRHPAYRNFPVVGISYEQAVDYCKWRTNEVKTNLSSKKNFKNQNFEYRLPSKAEWEFLAGTSANVLYNDGKNTKGEAQLNVIDLTYRDKPADGNKYPDVTAPVNSYKPNSLGLYNMLGNVAEMVQEKNIIKGGSWRNKMEDCRPGKDVEFSKPNASTGFRCVCIIKRS